MTVSEVNTSSSPEVIIALEQSNLKVPFEQCRRNFRNELKIVDRDLPQLLNILSDLGELDAEKGEKIISKLELIADKFRQQKIESQKYRERALIRLGEVNKLISNQQASNLSDEQKMMELERWQRIRNYRLMTEYLLQKGFHSTARILMKQYHLIDGQVDIEFYEENKRIESYLSKGIANECLSWCSENRAALKKNKSDLEFIVRRQEFVELARKRDLNGAINYAKKYFTTFYETNEAEIDQAMSLIALKPEFELRQYKWIYDPARWSDIASQFTYENHILNGLAKQSQLTSLIYTGLAALRTNQCSNKGEHGQMRSFDCPVCAEPLSRLTQNLPVAHHETSILVCPISGATMDADNAPMALPNGNVYSQKVLEQMAARMNGNIICPKTKKTFRFVEARKCFIS